MSDRVIFLRENQRRVYRGMSYNARYSRYELDMEEDETLKVIIDATGILATSETVTAATATTDGITCAVVLATPLITLTLSAINTYGSGDITLLVTLSGGSIFKLRIRARSIQNNRYYDYYTAVPS